MKSDKRLLVIFGLVAVAGSGLMMMPPIKQDSAYHLFADTRRIAGIPHCFNVVSNAPFLFIGLAGIRQITLGNWLGSSSTIKYLFMVFFTGLVLTGLGSSYYHLHPDNFTLVWDRIPMTIAFTAFFCLVVAECISHHLAIRLLSPLLVMGLFSVLYWYQTEINGHGDLRPYLLIQFLPVVLIPLILGLYKANSKCCAYVWAVLGFYVMAKIAESFDSQLYHSLIIVSGHTIKHLLAGMGTYFIYRKLLSHTANTAINDQ
ncbi:MAG: alkaline phytoceramidase [Methylococcaceae bacterium]|nr:alkaline phytoceramidase [Methylococcaceae bacterium]